jgi:hypothetical protein
MRGDGEGVNARFDQRTSDGNRMSALDPLQTLEIA